MKIYYAYINVELYSSVKSIKYVTKYINEGSDQATFSLQSTNEVEQFRSGRYICSLDAIWRIMYFNIHERALVITHLSVHLENGRVYFAENNINNVVNNRRETTLTEFFKLSSEVDFFPNSDVL